VGLLDFQNIGKKIDSIAVKINYRIIELFSAGLYSSPNKAFEELVSNSYDAFANQVCVYVPSDLSVEGACIWVCDNGESMDQQGLKDLWNIGISTKRDDPNRDKERLQIGRFGIGKLATYVLAHKLTYVCKKNERYLATTIDYDVVSQDKDQLFLDEREIDEKTAEKAITPYLISGGRNQLSFDLFGEKAAESWSFALLTELKPKTLEIKLGRLQWVLRTALPLNPRFRLFFNSNEIQSSKIDMKIKKSWIFGKEDEVAESIRFGQSRIENGQFFVDFDNLKGVHGQIDLYEDSLLRGKSEERDRSHGIFLMVRGRLINLDDPLLGMPAFTHGVFNRTRIMVYADELDDNLTSTRESIKESLPLEQLKEYIKKKFNVVKKYYFEIENEQFKQNNISYRLSQTSLTLSKRPLYVFAEKFYNDEILNPILIEKPPKGNKEELLRSLALELSAEESIIKKTDWVVLGSGEPIAKLDLTTGIVKINLIHPFIANYADAYKSTLPLEFVAITEVLTEAHLYELGLDESIVNNIVRRRDNTLRELALSNRQGAPAVAQMLRDSLSSPTGLEDAVYNAFLALGFEASKIGGNGKPDGKADAILGFDNNKEKNYSLTYDAKSTLKDKISAGATRLSAIKRHQIDYNAQFSVVVSIDFDGADDPNSAVCKEAKEQQVTVMRAKDLMRLLLLWAPHQIGLARLKTLFENCYTPAEVSEWVDEVENERVKTGPFQEVLDTIYHLQKSDREAPDISTVRYLLNQKIVKPMSRAELLSLIGSLEVLIPGFISVEGDKVGVQGRPDEVMKAIHSTIQSVPNELHQKYLNAFAPKKVGQS
jgi:hypothetical protein